MCPFRNLNVFRAHFEPQVTLIDKGVAGDGDVLTRLERIYDEISAFCKAHGLCLHMTGLTRHLLSFSKDADYPCGNLNCIKDLCWFPFNGFPKRIYMEL